MVVYKVVSYQRKIGSPEELEKKLNEMAQEGWELVNVYGDFGFTFSIWKKEQ